ncbi:RAMP superfamily CRISPR-associated protein [Tepidibacillus fermentans]|uniref:RAMP superfamily protein n=1 Tax=Tepidibacillus fermentans TaxID=1281767 RepID=A0A4R3K7V9_9BACI|nr:RAMP superfamily CRISPR-associated protein [Tepidibacillus fermentans]TCS78935.1 RAMP superfamily protein [Tepidibacillus fermentans]
MEWAIQFKLLSETIFGSGESIPGSVDLEVVHDDYGLPYFKGKTLKGRLREEVENIIDKMKKIIPNQIEYDTYVYRLFGKAGDNLHNGLKISDATLGSSIKNGIRYGIESGLFTKEEVLQSLTEIRSFTSVNEKGVARKRSLRNLRVIKKGYIFYSQLYLERELEEQELELLAAGISSLRHIGTMVSKGKGSIEARLFCNGKDVTEKYVNSFIERMNKA